MHERPEHKLRGVLHLLKTGQEVPKATEHKIQNSITRCAHSLVNDPATNQLGSCSKA